MSSCPSRAGRPWSRNTLPAPAPEPKGGPGSPAGRCHPAPGTVVCSLSLASLRRCYSQEQRGTGGPSVGRGRESGPRSLSTHVPQASSHFPPQTLRPRSEKTGGSSSLPWALGREPRLCCRRGGFPLTSQLLPTSETCRQRRKGPPRSFEQGAPQTWAGLAWQAEPGGLQPLWSLPRGPVWTQPVPLPWTPDSAGMVRGGVPAPGLGARRALALPVRDRDVGSARGPLPCTRQQPASQASARTRRDQVRSTSCAPHQRPAEATQAPGTGAHPTPLTDV